MEACVEKANKFLDSYTATNLEQDPLPIRHVPKGITSDEAAGYSILWVYEYLYMRSCPLGLMQNAMKAVHEEMVKSSSDEAGKVKPCSMEPLHLMQWVVKKTDEFFMKIIDEKKQEGFDNSTMARYSLPWEPSAVGVYDVSYFAFKNKRRTMEDKLMVLPALTSIFQEEKLPDVSFVAAFDGHNGSDAALYGAAQLYQQLIKSNKLEGGGFTGRSLEFAFTQTDNGFIEKCQRESINSGATAVSVLLTKECIYVGWIGDSEASLHFGQGRVKQLVSGHIPSREDERNRIHGAGGEVIDAGDGLYRVNGQLAITRAIGNPSFKPFVSSRPEITVINRNDLDEDYIVIGSDGLWGRMSAVDVGEFVNKRIIEDNGEDAAELLAKEARARGETDNISVIIVYCKPISDLVSKLSQMTTPVTLHKEELGDHYDSFYVSHLDSTATEKPIIQPQLKEANYHNGNIESLPEAMIPAQEEMNYANGEIVAHGTVTVDVHNEDNLVPPPEKVMMEIDQAIRVEANTPIFPHLVPSTEAPIDQFGDGHEKNYHQDQDFDTVPITFNTDGAFTIENGQHEEEEEEEEFYYQNKTESTEFKPIIPHQVEELNDQTENGVTTKQQTVASHHQNSNDLTEALNPPIPCPPPVPVVEEPVVAIDQYVCGQNGEVETIATATRNDVDIHHAPPTEVISQNGELEQDAEVNRNGTIETAAATIATHTEAVAVSKTSQKTEVKTKDITSGKTAVEKGKKTVTTAGPAPKKLPLTKPAVVPNEKKTLVAPARLIPSTQKKTVSATAAAKTVPTEKKTVPPVASKLSPEKKTAPSVPKPAPRTVPPTLKPSTLPTDKKLVSPTKPSGLVGEKKPTTLRSGVTAKVASTSTSAATRGVPAERKLVTARSTEATNKAPSAATTTTSSSAASQRKPTTTTMKPLVKKVDSTTTAGAAANKVPTRPLPTRPLLSRPLPTKLPPASTVPTQKRLPTTATTKLSTTTSVGMKKPTSAVQAKPLATTTNLAERKTAVGGPKSAAVGATGEKKLGATRAPTSTTSASRIKPAAKPTGALATAAVPKKGVKGTAEPEKPKQIEPAATTTTQGNPPAEDQLIQFEEPDPNANASSNVPQACAAEINYNPDPEVPQGPLLSETATTQESNGNPPSLI